MRYLLLLLPLAGCDLVDQLKDKVDPYTETVATQSLLLGMAEPDDEALQAALQGNTDWEPGLARGTAFVANAASATDLASAPVVGANVLLKSDALGRATLDDDGGGKYESKTLSYPRGDDVTLSIDDGTARSCSTLAVAGLRDLAIDTTHPANHDLTVDASNENVDALLVVVIDADNQEVVFDSTPKDIQGMYEFTHGDGSTTTTIDGNAFSHNALYAVGVAGLKRAGEGTYDGLNPLLSGFAAGEVIFYPVVVDDAG